MKLLYEEFMWEGKVKLLDGTEFPSYLCGLCGNAGIVNTVGKVRSPAGVECGIERPCICPNGRAIKKAMPRPEVSKREGPRRYWLSWYEREKEFPKGPPAAVLGVWCSGEAMDGSYSTMVAWVEAENERSAQAIIRKHWGGRKKWRFCNLTEPGWTPRDRFPLSEKRPRSA